MYSNGVSEQITGRYLKEMGRRDELVVTSKVYGLVGEGALRSGRGDGPTAAGLAASTFSMLATPRCAGSEWITSTSIKSTNGTTPPRPRNSRSPRFAGPGRQGALPRREQHQGLGVCQGTIHRARARMASVCFDAESLYLAYREDERELVPLCIDQGVAMIPWRPFGRGFLTAIAIAAARCCGRARKAIDSVPLTVKTIMTSLTPLRRWPRTGFQPGTVALPWLLQAPGVTAPIIGATKLSHIDDAVKSLDVHLTPPEIAELEAPYQPHPDMTTGG